MASCESNRFLLDRVLLKFDPASYLTYTSIFARNLTLCVNVKDKYK